MKTETEYDVRVNQWLAEHRIAFSIVATGFRRGFNDDDTTDKLYHDTYHATFERDGKRFDVASFKQSAAHSKSQIERERCTCGGFTLHQKSCAKSVKHRFEVPSAYSILSAIEKSDPGTFRDFCGNYGYGEDSMRAHRTYLAVQEEYASAARFFTAAELDELQEIAS
jgi:hypothetical protein